MWTLGLVTFGFLIVLLSSKILTVLEIRSLTHKHLRSVNRIIELEADLDTSRQRYLIALKSEGVSKNKVSQLKKRHAAAKQQWEQIQETARQQEAQLQREKEGKLEALVLQALGGGSVRRDSHFKKVMSVISQMIDLDEHTNAEELMVAIQGKLAEIEKKGKVAAPPPKVKSNDQGADAEAPSEPSETARQQPT
jgi:hypothetical protein